ncbi:MAG: sugar phosphate isomerase/epimerase [Victivallaceae bacterium]|nr:sugar phosphate isomerase/epimerase [Victivallaceae bacterium]
MNSSDISISTTMFGHEHDGGLDLIECLEMIKASGFTMAEISHKQRNIKQRETQIRATEVKILAIHGSLGGNAGNLDETERKAAVEAEFLRLEDTAPFAPCPYVVHYLDRFNNPEHGRMFRKSIEELYVRSSQLGFNMAIETAPYKPQINERYPDSKEIADFVRSFAKPDLNMTIDINHSNLHESLVKVCENCCGIIAHVHMSDNHGAWEDHLPPGEGTINFPEVFVALRTNGYTGPWNLELHPEHGGVTLEWLKQVKQKFDAI